MNKYYVYEFLLNSFKELVMILNEGCEDYDFYWIDSYEQKYFLSDTLEYYAGYAPKLLIKNYIELFEICNEPGTANFLKEYL